jgi:hypothetical protein
VWGSANGTGSDIGVEGTSSFGFGGYFENDSDNGNPALYAFNNAPKGDADGEVFLEAGNGGFCEFDIDGDFYCSGNKSAVVPVDGGARTVALYAMESPENWFEDFGSGQLANGSARIELEPTFAQTVNTDLDYHVFLTPRGECEGLYVTGLTASGFEVRELHHGSSSIAFDYRIIAKRKNYETVRSADYTERLKKLERQLAKMQQQRPAVRKASDPASAAALETRH